MNNNDKMPMICCNECKKEYQEDAMTLHHGNWLCPTCEEEEGQTDDEESWDNCECITCGHKGEGDCRCVLAKVMIKMTEVSTKLIDKVVEAKKEAKKWKDIHDENKVIMDELIRQNCELRDKINGH